MGDCGKAGIVTPASANIPASYVHGGHNLVQLLQPGVYTHLACTNGWYDYSLEEPPPTPTNIDCAHATLVPASVSLNHPLLETRILEPARFYKLTVPAAMTYFHVKLASNQGWSDTTLTLHSLSTAFTSTQDGAIWQGFDLPTETAQADVDPP